MIAMNNAYTAENLMHKVYAWMFAGLLLTAGISYGLFLQQDLLSQLMSSYWYLFGLFAMQIMLVVYLSTCITTISYAGAIAGFLAYSFLVGITLSPIFLVFTMTSIFITFLSASCMFGGMALYGYYTKTDLTKYGNLLLMGLWGLLVASVINLFFQSGAANFGFSCFGVLLFTALTAYDVQKIKQLVSRGVAYEAEEMAGVDMGNKMALLGALTLYLDFINLFLQLLNLMGQRRQD